MKKQIFVTGLCTLHWGRLQYGNVGNYYIIEPLFRELHKYFSEYDIVTTFQMDDEFSLRENVKVVPMDLYYTWQPERDVEKAEIDVKQAEHIIKGEKCICSEYINEVKKSSLVINVSGDMWGDNAEHVGHNRFLVDALKMKAAQVMNVPTVLFAVTPGPFNIYYPLAKEVFEAFDLVVIREKVSKNNLIRWGISTDNVIWAPCPSYLFKANMEYESEWTHLVERLKQESKKIVGLTFGGFNMPVGPYDMWPRDKSQYNVFVSLVKNMLLQEDVHIFLFSHTNGFELSPKFKLINGRDFSIMKQFYEIMVEENIVYKYKMMWVSKV